MRKKEQKNMSFLHDLEDLKKTTRLDERKAIVERWPFPPSDPEAVTTAIQNSYLCLGFFRSQEWFDFLVPHVHLSLIFEKPTIANILSTDNEPQLSRIVEAYKIGLMWSGPGLSLNLLEGCVEKNAIECFSFFVKNQSTLRCFNQKSLFGATLAAIGYRDQRLDFLTIILKNKSKKFKSIASSIDLATSHSSMFQIGPGSSKLFQLIASQKETSFFGADFQSALFRWCLSGHKDPAVSKEWKDIFNHQKIDRVAVFKKFVKEYPMSDHSAMIDLFPKDDLSVVFLEKKTWPAEFKPYKNHPNLSRVELISTVASPDASKKTAKKRL